MRFFKKVEICYTKIFNLLNHMIIRVTKAHILMKSTIIFFQSIIMHPEKYQ